MELLLFVSSRCPVCPKAERIVKKIARNYSGKGLEFRKVRTKTREGKVLVGEMNINATPTIIFLDQGGNEVKRIVGVPEESDLKNKVEKMLGLKKSPLDRILGWRK